jgi:hypothetical protein
VIESRREGLERFLSIVAGHPLLQVRFAVFKDDTIAILTMSGGNRLEAKFSAPSYRTQLGIGPNGSERSSICFSVLYVMSIYFFCIVVR